jgi:hypothetical protein
VKLAGWKRVLLSGLMTLSVLGGSLATFTAGNAAAGGGSSTGMCYPIGHGDIYECDRN